MMDGETQGESTEAATKDNDTISGEVAGDSTGGESGQQDADDGDDSDVDGGDDVDED